MFLSDKCSIKEVLLFPQMKPDDAAAWEKQQASVAAAKARGGEHTVAGPALDFGPASKVSLKGTPINIASADGMDQLNDLLKKNAYLGGYVVVDSFGAALILCWLLQIYPIP